MIFQCQSYVPTSLNHFIEHLVHLVLNHPKFVPIGGSTKRFNTFLTVGVPVRSLTVETIGKVSKSLSTASAAVVAYPQIPAAEWRAKVINAVYYVITIVVNHLLQKIDLQQKDLSFGVLYMGWSCIPFVMSEACNRFSKLCASNNKGILDVVAMFVESSSFELMFWGSEE